MTLRPGMTLAHYRLDRKIGAGGMGEVWRATDSALDRAVAIKFSSLLEVAADGAGLELGVPRTLSTRNDIDLAPSDTAGKPALDIDASGRFLVVRRSSADPRRGILVVENWFEEFRAR